MLTFFSCVKSVAVDFYWPCEGAVHSSSLYESLELFPPHGVFHFKLKLSQLVKKRGFGKLVNILVAKTFYSLLS